MSHFTVTVRLTEQRLARHGGEMRAALDEIMAPFYENTEDERFLEFEDEEDEMREKYATGSTDRVRMPDGSLLLPWDEKFRVPGTFGTGGGSHKVPEHLERVAVPFRETFSTFEEYAKEWHGSSGPNKKTGRYGYFTNPNRKWDWFEIGGRWTGTYPLKPGAQKRLGRPGVGGNKPEPNHGDIVRVGDIDFDAVTKVRLERATKFFREYVEMLGGKEFQAFEGPRHTAMDLGLVRVEQGPVTELKPGERVVSWETMRLRPDDERRHWHDVVVEIDEATFFREHLDHFNPIATYAGLDDEGWVEPGRMGWFASSSATPETYRTWKQTFHDRFIAAAAPDDLLVCVDCHI